MATTVVVFSDDPQIVQIAETAIRRQSPVDDLRTLISLIVDIRRDCSGDYQRQSLTVALMSLRHALNERRGSINPRFAAAKVEADREWERAMTTAKLMATCHTRN